MISWSLDGDIGDVKIVEDDKEYRIKEVSSLNTMVALITKEVDSMSAMRFRMNKADKGLQTVERGLLQQYAVEKTSHWTMYLLGDALYAFSWRCMDPKTEGLHKHGRSGSL